MSIYAESNGKKNIIDIFANVNDEKKGIVSAWMNRDGVITEIFKKGDKTHRFVVIANNGYPYYSLDGVNWTEMSGLTNASSNYKYFDVAYGKGIYVTVNQLSHAYQSSDGVEWKRNSISGVSGTSISYIAYGANQFIGAGKNYIYSSLDGVTWKNIMSITNLSPNNIVYAAGRFILVANKGMSYYSIDGVNWTPMSGLNTAHNIRSVCYGNNKFVAVGEDGVCYHSSDGMTWVNVNNICADDIYAICYGKDKFVCVGKKGIAYYSVDGINWTEISGLYTGTDNYAADIIYGNDRFIYANGGNGVYYSLDGINWTLMSGLNTSGKYRGLAYGK